MKDHSKTRFAILGLLKTMGPQTGYSLKKRIKESCAHFWSESFGSLYPTLAILEKQGAIEGKESVSSGGRRSVIYQITPAGSQILKEWLAKPARESPLRSEMLLKLFFSHERPHEITVEQLTTSKNKAEERSRLFHKMTQDLLDSSDPSAPYWQMTLRLGELHNQALIQWCQECLSQLQENHG